MLRKVGWLLVNDVSGQPIGITFKGLGQLDPWKWGQQAALKRR